jgi:intein/homing endonuclease
MDIKLKITEKGKQFKTTPDMPVPSHLSRYGDKSHLYRYIDNTDDSSSLLL